VPDELYLSGITRIVAPIPNLAARLWTPLADYNLILYPYINGRSGMEIGLSDEQWTELGIILRQIHGTGLRPLIDGIVRRESFIPNTKWTAALQAIEPKLTQTPFNDSYEAELAAFWNQHADEIKHIINRTGELGQSAKARSLPFVLCHADIHTANVLVDSQGQLFIIDWDGPIFAPKERDLMFIVEQNSEGVSAFFKGYGAVEIDWQAIAYYRYEWVVQEIAEYGELIFLTSNLGDVTRAEAVRGFKQLFDPGDVVDEAYKSETR
jgi:spectinomycin phosphotransferase